MFIDFDEYIKYLTDKKITPNQFALCWMIHNRDINNMEKYITKVGKFKREDINYLLDTEYLLTTNVDNPDFNSLLTTEKFSSAVFIDGENALKEIIDIYPPYIRIDRKNFSTTAVDRESLALYYDKKIIKGNRLKHQKILEKSIKVIEMMKRGDIATIKIDKFIRGYEWEKADLDDEESGDMFREL